MLENNEYVNFSFEPADDAAHENHQVTPGAPAPAPNGKKPHKHGHKALGIVALAVACALVGGAGGGAITAYALRGGQDSVVEEQTTSTSDTGSKENVIVNNVVHTNQGNKDLTPQEVYEQYVDTVVGITTSGTTTNIWGQVSEFAASGSGFIITEDGYIVTNHHVIADASSVKVTLYDGSTYDAEIVGSDESNDVALLKINATGLHCASIGDSDQVEVGEQVAAIGNPLGELTFTLTVGYVSALDRAINTDGTPINMLQTDASINSGNSGGPLFDMNGNVIGITTAKYSGSTSSGTSIEGIGFAIPINDAMAIVNDLQTYGYVTGQAYLGVSVQDLDTNTAKYYSLPAGVYVVSVTEGSCSEKAGLREGDIITGLDDKAVESYSDLAAALKEHKAGETVELSVYREGQTLSLSVTLDEKQPEEEQPTVQDQSQTQQVPNESQVDPFEFFFGN